MTKHAKTLLEELPDLLGEDSQALSVDEIAEQLDRLFRIRSRQRGESRDSRRG